MNMDEGDMNIDKVLEELGPFGNYQAFVLVLLCLPNVLGAIYGVSYVFAAEDVNYRCSVPECEPEYGSGFFQSWTQYSVPNNSRCERYEVEDWQGNEHCSNESFNAAVIVDCNSWIYEQPRSFVEEFHLACQDYKRTAVGSVRSIGTIFGLILAGLISDGFGRKRAFCFFALCAGICGVAKSFAGSYIAYVIIEFAEAILGYGFNSAGYVMIVELARPSRRVLFTSMTGIAYGIGGALFGVIAWQVPYWRDLLRVVYIPSFFFLTYIFLLDESPRWLHVKGKNVEASEIISRAASWNNIQLSKNAVDFFNVQPNKCNEETTQVTALKVICSHKLLLRILFCSLCWIASSFVYYGLTINSVSMDGNKYINFSLGSLAEIVATLFIMMSLDRFGRKKCIFVAFLLCGISCIMPLIDDSMYTTVTFFFVGKLGITYAFNSMYVFTAELFPTEARSSLLSSCSLIGRIGSILAPQTPLLALYNEVLPNIVFGVVSIIAALIITIIPETANTRLPETVSDSENIHELKVGDATIVTEL